eukprot:4690889-Pleurochrysis_carterae.AAC.2
MTFQYFDEDGRGVLITDRRATLALADGHSPCCTCRSRSEQAAQPSRRAVFSLWTTHTLLSG